MSSDHATDITLAFIPASMLVLTLMLSAIGWQLGYREGSAYLAFWVSITSVLLAATRLAFSMRPWRGPADGVIRVAIITVAMIVACGLTLGAAGIISRGSYVIAMLLLFAGSRLLPAPQWPKSLLPQPRLLPIAAGSTAALLTFAIAYAMTHAPLTLYDSLSYHLLFPARWLQEGRLSIVPTPFSAPSQAYSPGNGELFFLWLMAPFHGDFLARVGQLPFCLLCMTTIYALARRLGARPVHAFYPAALFLFGRMILDQAVGADVDLVCAATFMTSLYCGIEAIDSRDRQDWILFGISLGLYWGSKYLALVYTPVFVFLLLARGVRKAPLVPLLWAVPGVVVFALPWYLRNWIVAGSPLYPASLQVAGLTLARGAFSRAAMMNSVFHTDDVRLFPVMLAHLFGPSLFVVWVPLAFIGAIAMVRKPWWPGGWLWLVPFSMMPLYWFGFPVNVDSRFLMPAVGPALVPIALLFGRDR
ncbi:MAG TPA: glycosyltransferase family 39 protein, partial [Vicinamibacterales bacterium]|nr:glycosyltransferase family 39 protein [Vicinamibacterales bacterium]